MDFRRGASHAAEAAAESLRHLYLGGATPEDMLAFSERFADEVLIRRRIDTEFVLSDLAAVSRMRRDPKTD
jgi:hypothetical protein